MENATRSVSYQSTRASKAENFSFADVLMTGLAPDGGLYCPLRLPALGDVKANDTYSEAAVKILEPFVAGAFDTAQLTTIVNTAYSTFESPEVCPLKDLGGDVHLLDLSTGPTLAFKDVAMQLLSGMLEAELQKRSEKAVIVGATSGDTGAAAIAAFANKQNIEIVMLHPHERVSPTQRRQMTTIEAANVHNIAVKGTFDDCQDLVKQVFAEQKKPDGVNLVAVNSINWARVMAQMVYYITSAAKLQSPVPVNFVVPSGNFGNVLAGWYAKQLGANIGRLIVASNSNDVLTRFFETGRLQLGEVTPTISPSMDIQVSSNLERLLWEASGRDGAAIAELMANLRANKVAEVPALWCEMIGRDFVGYRVDDDETRAQMARIFAGSKAVCDPHTAVGFGAANKFIEEREAGVFGAGSAGPVVVLATAHPAKFGAAVRQAIGVEPPEPAALAGMAEKVERFDVVEGPESFFAKLEALNRPESW